MSDTQNNKVLTHLQTVGPITQMQALRAYGISRLAARVRDLRDSGYQINTQMVEVRNRVGDSTRVARYTLMAKKKSPLAS